MLNRRSIICVAVALAVGACAQESLVDHRQPTLAGTSWVLASSSGGENLAPARTTLAFRDDANLAGDGGCNRYFASYRREGGNLQVSALGSSRKACRREIMDHEQAYFARLVSCDRVRVADESLVLGCGSPENSLIFVPDSNEND